MFTAYRVTECCNTLVIIVTLVCLPMLCTLLLSCGCRLIAITGHEYVTERAW